jgi:hypothetical protein
MWHAVKPLGSLCHFVTACLRILTLDALHQHCGGPSSSHEPLAMYFALNGRTPAFPFAVQKQKVTPSKAGLWQMHGSNQTFEHFKASANS